MSVDSLLTELSRLGIRLALSEGGQLSISAPRGSVSDHLRELIVRHKTALLDWLAGPQAKASSDGLPVILPDPSRWHEPFPLGDLQTAFVMGDCEDFEHHVRPHYYVEQDMPGLDGARYEAALNAALRRQRANLLLLNGDMQLQVVPELAPVRLVVHDLRGMDAAGVQQQLLATRERLSRKTLPLDRWPWFDCELSLYHDGQARLHWNNNNFFSDGYGTYRLLADVQRLYEHPDRPLPALSLSYRDCVLALEQLERSPLGEASQRYWQDRQPHLPPPPALPLKAGLDPRRRSWLQRRDMLLAPELWAGLQAQARENGVTPTNALFAAYAEVLARWSGSRHFLLSNMVTHRLPLHPQINDIVGNFASLYPLEVDGRAERFNARARQLQHQVTLDLQHVHWSGVKVLQGLNQAQKSAGRAGCPFVVGSGLFMPPLDAPSFGCLETPQVMLDHQFWEIKDGSLWVVWDVIEDCFPPGLIDAMWAAYRSLLMRLAQDVSAWHQHGFELLPSEQRAQRAEVNQTGQPLPAGLLHEGLARAAQRWPEKAAVIDAVTTLSYAGLHGLANAVAHRLLKEGLQPGDRVAVVLHKGWQQAVAVHGALAAGAVYVPIGADWPQSRVHLLIDKVQASVVLTSRALRDTLAWPSGAHLLCLDDGVLGQPADAPPRPVRSPADLAYILFTSGSTGEPKGVMIDHRGALNTVADINQRFGIGEADVVFGVSSLHFDLSVYDLFGTALAGATLVLPSAGESPQPAAWLTALQRHGVTVWNSVPALMQLLVDAAQASGEALPALRQVLLSGDWIPVTLPAQVLNMAPHAQVTSLGGATEASIWSIFHPIRPGEHFEASVPYGRPLANQRWYVLQDDGGESPEWVPGHLYIAGDGLALGYWQDAERTRAAFVQHPLSGERLYRTGDMGRWRPGGDIEFLGRADLQVKVQGHRIEPGEVEQALLAQPEVQAAAVVAQGGVAGRQLLGFAVPAQGVEPDADAVLAALRLRLPRFMVPGRMVWLKRLPLTANGKLDRQALLAHDDARPPSRPAPVAPRTPVEAALVKVWEDILEVGHVSIHDDFFELGGQSFAAARVMTRLAQQLQVRLPLSTLLEGRTIAHLADCIERRRAWAPLVVLHPDGEGTPLFLVHPAGGNVLCYRQLAGQLGRPVYGLQATGLDGERPALDSVRAMATLYIQALRQKRPQGPYLLGGWSSGGVIAFEMASQLEELGESVERVVLIDTPAPSGTDSPDLRVLACWFLEDLDIGFDPRLLTPDELPPEPAAAALAAALKWMEVRQGLSPALVLRDLLPIFHVFGGIIRATHAYRPAVISAPLSILKAASGRVSEYARHPFVESDDWGWRTWTCAFATTTQVPGGHHTMFAQPHAEALHVALKEHLSGVLDPS